MKIISLLKIGVGAAFTGAVIFSCGAAEPGVTTLRGQVPAVVSRLQPVGQLPAAQSLNLALGLPLRNQAVLTNLLRELYDPASPNYHQYLTPDEFTAQFGPTEQDYQSVVDFARANGLTVTGTNGSRMLVDVTGKVSDIEKTFHVKMRTYPHPAEKREFFAPDTEPSVSGSVPLLHVSGLDDFQLPHSMLHPRPASLASPKLGSAPGGAYMGTDFRNAYVPGSALNGSGQTVGLLQFDSGYYQSDITAYETLAGLSNVPVQAILLDGYGGGPGNANDEVSLDIEMVISMAPGVSKILVFEGSTTDDILSAMAASNTVKQLSASWSYPVDAITQQIYKQFAAQGQSFFNASGDYDSWAGFGFVFPPCDDPYITIVGGTTLTTAVTNGPWTSETVWNWGIEYGIDGIGSGGGISSTYAIPSWQTNINMTANQGSMTFRNIPDVALTADNVYVIYGGGAAGAFGGTSCATPLWAGFMALINQKAVASGKPTMGFINPAIYTLAEGANYTNCFHDITIGNNTWSASPSLFYAVAGYDLCTGWGTPNGINLINALVGAAPTHISAPPKPYGTTLSALDNGNPNGEWELFFYDDAPLDTGTNFNGWSIALTTANPVGYAADLDLTMTASASSISVGGDVVIYLAVTNYGPSASTNITVEDTLPAGATLVSSNLTLGSVNGGSSQLNWSFSSLATNAGAQLALTFQASSVGILTNTAIVLSSTMDPNPDDDSAAVAVSVGSVQSPQISSMGMGQNSAFALTIASPQQSTIIQASTNLINWVNVYTGTPPFTFTDPGASNYRTRFYRAVLGP